jgi:hypothetical protein
MLSNQFFLKYIHRFDTQEHTNLELLHFVGDSTNGDQNPELQTRWQLGARRSLRVLYAVRSKKTGFHVIISCLNAYSLSSAFRNICQFSAESKWCISEPDLLFLLDSDTNCSQLLMILCHIKRVIQQMILCMANRQLGPYKELCQVHSDSSELGFIQIYLKHGRSAKSF